MLLIKDTNLNSDISLAKLSLFFLLTILLVSVDIFAFKLCINHWKEGVTIQRGLPYILILSYFCLELMVLFFKKAKRKIRQILNNSCKGP